MRILLLSLVMMFTFTSCTTYFYVVRHAEKVDESDNPPLNDVGMARARVLRDTLKNKGIDSVFTSSTKIRTRQTAEPTAAHFNETIHIHNGTIPELITKLKNIQGKDVLVVGHSNEVPGIVQSLSGHAVPAINPDDYDNLYIIRIYKCIGTKRTLHHTTYGAISPSP